MKLIKNLVFFGLFCFGMNQAYVAMDLFAQLSGGIKYITFASVFLFIPMFVVLYKEISKKLAIYE